MRNLNLFLIALAFLAHLFVFREATLGGILFFLPFTMTPLAVTAALAIWWRAFWSQAILLASTLAYFAWFIFLYVDAVILHPDPQSPIVFLFVGIYGTPVLCLFWWIAYAIEWEHRSGGTTD